MHALAKYRSSLADAHSKIIWDGILNEVNPSVHIHPPFLAGTHTCRLYLNDPEKARPVIRKHQICCHAIVKSASLNEELRCKEDAFHIKSVTIIPSQEPATMMTEDPNSSDAYGTMNGNTNTNVNKSPEEILEDKSRKEVLESYEKAGVDLPLVSLETVLDREIVEDNARQTGAPRFRKLLNKASSAMANRGLNVRSENSNEVPDDEKSEWPDYEIPEEGPDDEKSLGTPQKRTPPVLSSDSYTSNSYVDYQTPPVAPVQREAVAEIPQTPDRPVNTSCPTEATASIIPPTPESMKNDCAATFDFCCPKTANDSPQRTSANDKYLMSKMQLADGFDDEQQSVDVEEARDVPALMDVDDSMADDNNSTGKTDSVAASMISKGNYGIMSYFRGSRRFRYAILVCFLLHIVLIGLIIAFVTNADNELYEAGSSAATTSQGQPATTPSSTDPITTETLFPDPVEEQLEVEEPTGSDIIANVTSPNNTVVEDNTVEENPTEQNSTVAIVPEDQPPANATDAPQESCVDSLDINMDCIGEDSELYVNFEVCTPLPGDWVAIYEASADPQFLLDTETIGWLYTCGDRLCEEVVEKEVLSFTRAKERAGVGTYRAHLIRDGGDGPIFASIASSPEFRIVTNVTDSC